MTAATERKDPHPRTAGSTRNNDHQHDDDVVSNFLLIRHGDRFDYANQDWAEKCKAAGNLVTDPPLSALGHRQAEETSHALQEILTKIATTTPAAAAAATTTTASSVESDEKKDTNENEHNHGGSRSGAGGAATPIILSSPYLRVIQTACPTSTRLGIPLCIEQGLSEAHATPGILPSPAQRFAYFPQIDVEHTKKIAADGTAIHITPGHTCSRTQAPCEAFAGAYVQRMERVAAHLEDTYYGTTVLCFSHAASVALVAALLRTTVTGFRFAPCGIYHLQRVNRGNWHVVRRGDTNAPYVTTNSPTTYPWGFEEKHFQEAYGQGTYYGNSVGIGLDYFVEKTAGQG